MMDDRKQKARKAIGWLLGLTVASFVVWYIGSSLSGVFGRSTATLSGTSWISFDSERLEFSGNKVSWYVKNSPTEYAYTEESGIATVEKGDEDVYLVRVRDDRLETSDGRKVFYFYE